VERRSASAKIGTLEVMLQWHNGGDVEVMVAVLVDATDVLVLVVDATDDLAVLMNADVLL